MFPVLLAEEDYNYFEGYVIIKRNKDKQQVYLVTIVSRQDLIGNRAFVVAALKLYGIIYPMTLELPVILRHQQNLIENSTF